MSAPERPGYAVYDRRTWVWLGILLLASAAYAARHWITYDGFIDAVRDESIYLPAILKRASPGLYANDYFLSHFQLSTDIFLDVSVFLLELVGGDYKVFLLTYSTALLFVFTSGVFVLVRSITGSPVAAFLSGLLLMRPREATGGVGFAVYVGNYQPRIFIDAMTPWFFWALLRSRTPLGHAGIGVVLGFTSCFYPVYPLQLAAIFALMLLFMKRGRDAVALLLAFAVPFMFCHFGALLAAVQPLTETAVQVIKYRWGGQLYPSADVIFLEFLRNLTLPFSLAVAGVAACPALLSENPRFRYFLLTVPAVAALIAAGYLSYAVPAMLPLMPQRLGRLYHLVFLSVGAAGAAALLTKDGQSRLKMMVLVLLAVNFFYTAPLPLWKSEGKTRSEMTALEKKEFLSVAEAARVLTPKDAVFLIPTRGSDNFQLYSQRAVVVSYKTLSSIRDPKVLEYWYRTHMEVAGAYQSGSLELIKEAALRYGAGYVLLIGRVDSGDTPLFSGGRYSIYRVDGI